MKKKLSKHIFDIATNAPAVYCYQYKDESGMFYVTDTHRLITYDTVAMTTPALSINAHALDMIKRMKAYVGMDKSCVRFELPTVNEIKDNIRNLVGKCYSLPVEYGTDKFAIDARYLWKAMEALNSKVCYIAEDNPHKNGIFLYEDDDLTSPVKEMILPIVRKDPEKVGFFLR